MLFTVNYVHYDHACVESHERRAPSLVFMLCVDRAVPLHYEGVSSHLYAPMQGVCDADEALICTMYIM